MTATAMAATRSREPVPKPPLATPTRNATTAMIAPYITIFSLAFSLFQNAWIVGGIPLPPCPVVHLYGTCSRERSVRAGTPEGVRQTSGGVLSIQVGRRVDVREGGRGRVERHPGGGRELDRGHRVNERLEGAAPG